MAEKAEAVHMDSIEAHQRHAPIDVVALEHESPMQHVAELQASEHIHLTWKS